MIVVTVIFIVIAVILCIAALLALLGAGHLALSGPAALERDGLARGRRAPAWKLADTAGSPRTSPAGKPLQLIMLADHCLKSFPSVVAGLRALREDQGIDIVILTRGAGAEAVPLLEQIGLGGIPVVTGSAARYASYNVRVMPFAIFVDSAGRVRASSLVNHDWQLAKLAQVAAIDLDCGELARSQRRARPGRRLLPGPAGLASRSAG